VDVVRCGVGMVCSHGVTRALFWLDVSPTLVYLNSYSEVLSESFVELILADFEVFVPLILCDKCSRRSGTDPILTQQVLYGLCGPAFGEGRAVAT
jgi:hypothetical protein